MDLIVDAIGNFFLSQNPGLAVIFSIVGSAVTLVSTIDAIVPKNIDNDRINDFLEKPVVSSIARFFKRFSLLRYKKDNEK